MSHSFAGKGSIILSGAALGVSLLFAPDAHAYVGPGAGLGILGAILAVIAAVLASIVGLVLWPVRRYLRRRKEAPTRAEPHS